MAKKRAQALVLTNLELDVMQAVWAGGGEPVTVREVFETLNANRRKKLAYNTVQTMLTILKEKGAVRVKSGGGRAHLYLARRSRDEVTTSMVDDLVDRLFDGHVQPLLVHLVEDATMSRDELQRLRSWIDGKLVDDDEEDGR